MRRDGMGWRGVAFVMLLLPSAPGRAERPLDTAVVPASTLRPQGPVPSRRTNRFTPSLRLDGEYGAAGGGPSGQGGLPPQDCGVVQDYDFLTLSGRDFKSNPSGQRRLAVAGRSILWTENGEGRVFKADFDQRTFEPIAGRVGSRVDSIVVRGDQVFWLEGYSDDGTCGSLCPGQILKQASLDGTVARTLAIFPDSRAGIAGPAAQSLAVDETAAYVLNFLGSSGGPNPYRITRVLHQGTGRQDLVATGGLISGFAISDTTLYWQQFVRPPSEANQIHSMAKTGGPVTVLADALDHPGDGGVVVDGDELFFTEWTRILKMPLSGGTPVVVADGQFGLKGLAVHGADVYWIRTLGGLLTVPRAGGTPTTLAQADYPGVLAVDDAHVYWAQLNGSIEGAVKRLPRSGGAVTVLRASVDSPGGLALDAERVYIGQAGELAALPKTGGDLTTLADGIARAMSSLATDGTRVFVADGQRIKQVSVEGGPVTTFSRAGSYYARVHDLAVDQTSLYWILWSGTGDPGNLQKMALTGIDPPVTLATVDWGSGSVWLLGNDVYWHDSGAGKVRKVPKDTGDVVDLLTGAYGQVVVDTTGIYVAQSQGYQAPPGKITRWSLAGTDPDVLVTGFTSLPIGLAVDEHSVYWIHEGEVAKVPKMGGPITYLLYGLPFTDRQEAVAALPDGDVYFTHGPLNILVRGRPANALDFSASSVSVSESAGRALLSVTRTGSVHEPSFVDYETSDGTAVAGLDYQPRSGRLVFGPGNRVQRIEVPIFGDQRAQGPRTLLLRLSEPDCGRLGERSVGAVTILDDDKAGQVRLGASSYAVYEPGPYVTFTVERTDGGAGGVTVDYATVDGSAVAGTHYSSVSDRVTFAPGEAKRTLAVPILDDGVVDANKTFSIVLSDPGGGGSLGTPSSALVTIQEGNPVVQFTGPSFSAAERAKGAVISVRRNGPTTGTDTVKYATADGTAKAGERYQAVEGTLTFSPGATTRTFVVPLVNDSLANGSGTVLLTLNTPSAGTALGGQSTAVLTLGDDDRGGTLALSASTYRVPRTAASALVTVRRAGGLAGGVEVHYATTDGTAQQGVHYTEASGVLSFAPGEVTRTFTVPLLDPGAPTGDRTVLIQLSDAAGGAALGAPSTGTLVLEGVDPELAFGAATYRVNEAGPAARITVVRSGPKDSTVTVAYTTVDLTAQAGVDYTSVAGQLTFGPNVRVRSFDVPILASGEIEEDQTVLLQIHDPAGGAALGDPHEAVLTISTDEPVLSFAAASLTAAESSGQAVLRVRRAGPAGTAVSASVVFTDGSATAAADYGDVGATLTFPPGSLQQTLTVPLYDDRLDEPSETFQASLENPQGAIRGSAVATITIGDNDVAGQIFLEGATSSARESSEVAVLAVLRSGGTASGASVRYATVNGSAVAGTHYEATSGTLVFEEGETIRLVAVPLIGDGGPGPNRTFTFELTDPEGGAALMGSAKAVVWIVDDGS